MAASAAQIEANRRNSLRSKGPTTPEGKERSRGNALKHGLTGEGVVLPNEDAAEVERMFHDLEAEMRPSGPAGRILIRRIATLAVRMERSVLQETAALSKRVVEAEAEAEAAGLDVEEQAEAGRRAMFDPSKEASLARKYEAAAERGFFRALKELRQLEKQIKAADPVAQAEAFRKELGSFLPLEVIDADLDRMEADLDRQDAELARIARSKSGPAAPSTALGHSASRFSAAGGSFDLPFSIGRSR